MSSFSPSSSLKRRLPPPSSTNDDDAQDSRRPSKTTKLHNNASSPSAATTQQQQQQQQQQQHQHHHQQIYRSAPLTDRASTFAAAFSPTLAARALQAHPDFVSATHRIAAWRRPTAQRKLFAPSAPSPSPSSSPSSLSSSNRSLAVGRVTETGFDDDGEQHAGKRLANVLEKARDASIAFVLKELDRVEDEILKGMGDGGEEELDEEGDEAEAETTGPSQRDGEDGKAVGGDVVEERLGADHGEKVAEKQEQAESAVDDESPAERPES